MSAKNHPKYDEVRRIAEELGRAGKKATNRAVLKLMGGDANAIAFCLRAFRAEELSARLGGIENSEHPPEETLRAASSLVSALWKGALEKAALAQSAKTSALMASIDQLQAEIAESTVEHAGEVEGLRFKLQDLEERVERLTRSSEETKSDLASERTRRQEAELLAAKEARLRADDREAHDKEVAKNDALLFKQKMELSDLQTREQIQRFRIQELEAALKASNREQEMLNKTIKNQADLIKVVELKESIARRTSGHTSGRNKRDHGRKKP